MASHQDFVDYVAEQLRDTKTSLTRLTCLALQAQPKKRRK